MAEGIMLYRSSLSSFHLLKFIYFSPTAPDEDILTPNDAMKVCEEIAEAQNESYNIGLKLELEYHVVEGIHNDIRYKKPFDQLLHVLIEASKRVDPGLTWGSIVDALRSPGVNLPGLARKIANEHCPEKGIRKMLGSCSASY